MDCIELSLYVGVPTVILACIYMMVFKHRDGCIRRGGWNLQLYHVGDSDIQLAWRDISTIVEGASKLEFTGPVGRRYHLYVCIKGRFNGAMLVAPIIKLYEEVWRADGKDGKKASVEQLCDRIENIARQYNLGVEVTLLNFMHFVIFRKLIEGQSGTSLQSWQWTQ